jgi:hypothetical protein
VLVLIASCIFNYAFSEYEEHTSLLRNYFYEVYNFLAVAVITLMFNDYSVFEGCLKSVFNPNAYLVSIITNHMTKNYYYSTHSLLKVYRFIHGGSDIHNFKWRNDNDRNMATSEAGANVMS